MKKSSHFIARCCLVLAIGGSVTTLEITVYVKHGFNMNLEAETLHSTPFNIFPNLGTRKSRFYLTFKSKIENVM